MAPAGHSWVIRLRDYLWVRFVVAVSERAAWRRARLEVLQDLRKTLQRQDLPTFIRAEYEDLVLLLLTTSDPARIKDLLDEYHRLGLRSGRQITVDPAEWVEEAEDGGSDELG